MKTQVYWAVVANKLAASAIIAIWTGIPAAIQLFMGLAAIDLFTTAAFSSESFWPVLKRIVMSLILVGSLHLVFWMGVNITGLNLGINISVAVCIYFVWGQLIRLTRLSANMGVPIPPQLLAFLQKAEGIETLDGNPKP